MHVGAPPREGGEGARALLRSDDSAPAIGWTWTPLRGERRAEGKGAETSETCRTLAGNQSLDFSVGAKDGDASTERVEKVV